MCLGVKERDTRNRWTNWWFSGLHHWVTLYVRTVVLSCNSQPQISTISAANSRQVYFYITEIKTIKVELLPIRKFLERKVSWGVVWKSVTTNTYTVKHLWGHEVWAYLEYLPVVSVKPNSKLWVALLFIGHAKSETVYQHSSQIVASCYPCRLLTLFVALLPASSGCMKHDRSCVVT